MQAPTSALLPKSWSRTLRNIPSYSQERSVRCGSLPFLRASIAASPSITFLFIRRVNMHVLNVPTVRDNALKDPHRGRVQLAPVFRLVPARSHAALFHKFVLVHIFKCNQRQEGDLHSNIAAPRRTRAIEMRQDDVNRALEAGDREVDFVLHERIRGLNQKGRRVIFKLGACIRAGRTKVVEDFLRVRLAQRLFFDELSLALYRSGFSFFFAWWLNFRFLSGFLSTRFLLRLNR